MRVRVSGSRVVQLSSTHIHQSLSSVILLIASRDVNRIQVRLEIMLPEKVFFFFEINFEKINLKKMNYFSIFGSVIENKLENIFYYLVMS